MGDLKDTLSFRLFARPSFVEGMARNLDLGGTMQDYRYNRGPKEADIAALASDWRMVGRDLKNALEDHEQQKQTA